MGKKRTTITIDKDLLDFARHLGLNLSGFLEERLRELKQRLDTGTGTLREGFEPIFTSKNYFIYTKFFINIIQQ